MSTSVGTISLDMILNGSQFRKQMSNIQNQANSAGEKISASFKKIGLAVAAAFSVKKIADFGKECIDLGSNLAEVQNVVDVTFTTMSNKVDQWAKSAANSYGLSETMAKKFTGTFGSMAEAFGFTEKQSYDMATALTGLAGDVASFYNISQDEAYTKLKSVFSGETETLKDLGVVMTQNALDNYALAQGIGKTTAKMTEAEKVSLRFSFVQSQLANAQGDFSRTSDSWANQVRVLQLRFDSLKATLGQAFIKVLTPVIKLLNSVIEKISVAAQAFSDFINKIFGEDNSSAMGNTASEIVDASANLQSTSDSANTNLNNAAKSAESIKNSLAGFDKLNVIGNKNDGSEVGADSGISVSSGVSGLSQNAENTGKSIEDKLTGVFQNLYENSGAKTFIDKVQTGIDSVNWSNIDKNCQTIFNNLKPIASHAMNGVLKVGKSAFGTLGSIIGGQISVVGKSVETVSGGVAKWLQNDKEKIIKFIDDISTNYSNGFDNLSGFFDQWYGLMGQSIDRMRPTMEGAISTFLSGMTDFAGNIGLVFSSSFEIATDKMLEWVENDAPEISLFFDNLQLQIADVLNFFGGVFSDIGTIVGEWWFGSGGGAEIFENVCEMFTNIGTTFMNVYNEWIMPVWNFIVGLFQSAWDNCLKPVFDSLLGFFGKVADGIASIWNFISPFVNWIIDVCAPYITMALNAIGAVFDTLFSIVGGVISGIIDFFSGLIDFFVGVFTLDFDKAIKGFVEMVVGAFEGIWSVVKGIINLIIDGINMLWTGIYVAVKAIVDTVGGVAGAIGDLFGQDWHFSMPEEPPLIPKLAQGGIIKAPTLALVGDNAGANTGDPEVVSPLSKLQTMINTSSGQDTVILTQILEYLKKLYELFLLFKAQGGNCFEFSASLNGNEIFNEMIYQNELYKKRHNGESAF